MRIREFIEDEITLERKLLEDVERKIKKYPCKVLMTARNTKGYRSFYYKDKTGSKRRYIKAAEADLLRSITQGKLLNEQKSILFRNIKNLEWLLDNICDYDTDSIMKGLPKTYQQAAEYLDKALCEEVCIQSESTKNPEGLNVICSNGLKVRSKNEMTICEMLLLYGIEFRYEAALELSKITVRDDGTAVMVKKIVYPDFTIFLPDGTVIYWEHFGMLDKEDYRNSFAEKMLLYYDNDIYPPKNLIITMDGPGKGFDNQAIKRIIEERILPMMG